MSDPYRRTSIPAGQGGEALRHGLDEGLPESGVLQAQFEALKVELLAALRPEPKEAPPLPLFGELVALWLACGGSETLPGRPRESVCTGCQVLRWPVPKVRPYRWYDLRHHAASAHRRAGADPLAIAIVLGHSLGSTTTERTYTHFTLDDLHRELGKWQLPR